MGLGFRVQPAFYARIGLVLGEENAPTPMQPLASLLLTDSLLVLKGGGERVKFQKKNIAKYTTIITPVYSHPHSTRSISRTMGSMPSSCFSGGHDSYGGSEDLLDSLGLRLPEISHCPYRKKERLLNPRPST